MKLKTIASLVVGSVASVGVFIASVFAKGAYSEYKESKKNAKENAENPEEEKEETTEDAEPEAAE